MAKKAAKPAPAAAPEGGDAAPKKKRSKIKLALFALVPLIALGGGGYGAWAYFLAPALEVHAEGEHGEVHPGGIDPQKVAALALEAAAETSVTYNFALAELLRPRCGALKTDALKTASDAEAAHDGMLVSRSWQAALRRAGTVTEASCERILGEIDNAEFDLEGGGAKPDKGGHGEKPAAH